ncbi:MAG: efflux RND transporter periplasmic adaptor subunit [Lachnospiraceae bacterium]
MKEKLKKHKKLLIVAGIVIVIAVLILTGIRIATGKRKEMMEGMTQTETAQVEKRTLMSSISATGSITSAESKEIVVSLNNAEVESVNVKVGDIVAAGDVLCSFNAEDIEENLTNAQINLNASTQKSQIDLAAAQRSLQEAVESRNIELERANQDVADAWSDYEEAAEDAETAENNYKAAQNTTSSLKAQLNQLAEKKKKLEEQKNTYSSSFNTAKSNLLSYIANEENGCKDTAQAAVASISIDTTLSLLSSDIKEETDEVIDGYLTDLKTAQEGYLSCVTSEQKLADSTELEKQYTTAQQNESSLKNTYEQAVSQADAKLDSYNQKVRSKEDTARSSESTIANKTDSVKTSELNAGTTGLSDKQQIEEYKEELEDCTVKAPFAGIITSINVEEGEQYSGNAIATIEDISSYKISTEIDEYDISDIQTGQKAVIKTNGTGDLELDGTVETIAPRATSGSSDVTYTVTISVDTPCEDLKLDMTAKVSIILESKENVLTVPYDAVQEDEEGNNYIEVIGDGVQTEEKAFAGEKEGRGERPERRIYITKGIESDYYIEVISDEVNEGMQVVIPQSEDSQSARKMIMRQGPMGGF